MYNTVGKNVHIICQRAKRTKNVPLMFVAPGNRLFDAFGINRL